MTNINENLLVKSQQENTPIQSAEQNVVSGEIRRLVWR